MVELLSMFSGGIAVGIVIRLVCVLLGGVMHFMDTLVRAV